MGRKRNIPKSSTPKETLNVLEQVHVDIQGPFPIDNVDGTRMNIKAVDKASGYIKMELIDDKRASTTMDFIRRYHVRSERQTGESLKIVATDSGTEFGGEFLSYLEERGIVKRKGQPYDHHYPSFAENANRLVLNIGRPSLLASKLPEKYYGESMLYGCYVLNRWSEKGKKSRYEIFFGKEPKNDHIQPFGAVCYAWIPKEKRGKQEPIRERCRLIGFGDDDDSEEMAGYKLIIESDQSVIYCNDVVFSKEEMKPLPDLEYYVPDLFEVFRTNEDDNEFVASTATSGTTNRDEQESESVEDIEIISNSDREEPASKELQDNYLATIQPLEIQTEEEIENARMEDVLKDLQSRDWYKNANLVKCFLTHTQDKSVPKNQKEAYASNEKDKWIAAEKEEMNSIREMNVYDKILDVCPENVKSIGSRWVYAIKYDAFGTIERYKARLVGLGFMEKYGLDYQDIFAPVANVNTIRITCAIAAVKGWKVYQDDAKTAFLHAPLQNGKMIKLPNGKFIFITKALYGLKEAPREWFKTFRQFMLEE